MHIKSLLSHPCHLIIGPPTEVEQSALKALKQALCPQEGCEHCIYCQQIEQKQHQSILWLTPIKNYKKEDLKPIEEKTAYQLDEHQHFFIIITQADLLNPACSNSLLKLIEEPPNGYHFLLCASKKDALLPTIVSRSLVTTLTGAHETSTLEQFHQIFKQINPDFIQFLSLLDAHKPTEQEALVIVEDLLNKCINQNETKNFINNEKIAILKQQLAMPPMPGSAKIYLKNVFLALQF